MARIYRSPISYGINTCHAPLLLRKDLVEHLRFLKDYCGFKYARCHGILNDTIHVAHRPGDGSAPEPVWAMVSGGSGDKAGAGKDTAVRHHFQQAHKVYANLLEIGLTPLVELSFLPRALAADPTKTCCHYKGLCSQPTSYEEWGDLIQAFGASMVKRFGITQVSRWRFCVWNEPNGGFWFPIGDKFEGYMKLYEAAARGLKKVSSRLQVGGPCTMIAGWAPPDTDMGKASPLGRGGPSEGAGWIENFIDRCKAGKIPVDFIETHLYPLDEYEIYNEKTRELYGPMDFFPKTIAKNNRIIEQRLPGIDVVWGEWSSNHRQGQRGKPFWDRSLSAGTFVNNLQYDSPFAGAFAAKIAGTFLAGEKMCWWTGSDVYEEWGWRHEPYHCGYGLLNLYGIPKPSAHAHHFAHMLDGGTILKQYARDGEGFLSVRKGGKNLLMFWNFTHPELPETKYTLDLSQVGFKVGNKATISLVDQKHANGRAVWESLGSPAELDPSTENKIRKGATVIERPLPPAAIAQLKVALEPNAFGVIVSG